MNKKRMIKKIKYFFRFIPDDIYIKIYYFCKLKKRCNLSHPTTFNEKLQWLKLHDREPIYTKMVDKCEAKEYVKEIVGSSYIIPTLGVWDCFDDIDFDSLPNQFVLKCTHDSEGLIVVKDKAKLDIEYARKLLSECLNVNFYYIGREWPYKNVKPRIIAEEYMVDESGEQLKDYKIHNFNGEPKIIQVDYDRFVNHKKNLYTTDWVYMNESINYDSDASVEITKPKHLDEMLELAKILSKGRPYLRTDFYSINDRIYFGELTFFPGSGFMTFNPPEFEKQMGEWIKLPIRG